MGKEDLCRVSQVPVHHGRASPSSRTGACDCSCGFRAAGFSVRGKFVLLGKAGYKIRGSPCD